MTTESRSKAEAAQFKIRLPADLLDRLEIAAQENGRSVTAEIVERLRSTLPDPMEELLARSEKVIAQLRQHLADYEKQHGPNHRDTRDLRSRLDMFERHHKEMKKSVKR